MTQQTASPAPPLPPPHPHILTKWRVLAAFWIVQAIILLAAGIVWQLLCESVNGPKGVYFGRVTASGVMNLLSSGQWWLYSVGTLIVMTLGQALLVWPVARPRARRDRGWPVMLSLAVAGIGIAVMGAALFLAFTQVLDLFDVPPPWTDTHIRVEWVLGAWCLICWAIATPLLWRFSVRRLDTRDRHEDVLGRIAARIFTGTIIEIAAIMPLDVMVRRKETCYCWSGTFFALSLCGGLGLILLGPMILFPALARRRKRWYAGVCDSCGYDMAALLESTRVIDRCPECGCGWKPEPQR